MEISITEQTTKIVKAHDIYLTPVTPSWKCDQFRCYKLTVKTKTRTGFV